MADQIRLLGLRFQACHGVLPHEKSVAQPFEVDLEVNVNLNAAGESDRVEDTVNYAMMADIVAEVMAGSPVALLERLASLIAEGILAIGTPESVRVRVRKMNPPMAVGGGVAEVEVFRHG